MKRLRLSPAVVLAILALVGGLVALLTAAPPAVTLRGDVRPAGPVELPRGEHCTALRVLPDETRMLRLQAGPGERLPETVTLHAGARTIGTAAPVRRGSAIEYRLAREVNGDHADASFCIEAGRRGSTLLGEGTTPAHTLLGAPRSNWIAALPLLTERAAFGRGSVLGGAALPLALLALAGAWLIALRLASTRHDSREPADRRTIALVAAVAALSGTAFAMTTPPIQAPDEMMHFHYAQLLADEGHVPQSRTERPDGFSPQLQEVMAGAAVGSVAFSPDRRPPWSPLADSALDDRLAQLPAGGAKDTFTNASSQPPGYYAVMAAAQKLTGGSVLDRLLVNRLLSALLFALGVAGAVLFAREAVPTAGGLVVAGGVMLAMLPLVGFIGGSVNPDAALLATSSWTLAVTAMILRRGLTMRRAVALGALIGLGLLSKLTFIGILPAVALAAVVVVVRGFRAGRIRETLAATGAALGLTALIALPYLAWAQFGGRGIAFGPPGPPGPVTSLRETFAYMFELYVGQAGPIADRIPGSGPIDIWAAGLAGRLGWLDFGFPRVVVLSLGVFWLVLAAGALWGIVRSARSRRALPVDAVIYAVAVFGIALLIARSGLVSRLQGHTGFEQARYLLPVAAIGVGGVALALRQLPRPAWREWTAAAVVVIALTHGTAAFFLTVGRYFA